LNCFTFRIDNFYFTVSRAVLASEPPPSSTQLPLDFPGELSYAKASVKIRTGRISVMFDGVKTSSPRVLLCSEESEIVIMIEVVDRRDAWVGSIISDQKMITSEPWLVWH